MADFASFFELSSAASSPPIETVGTQPTHALESQKLADRGASYWKNQCNFNSDTATTSRCVVNIYFF
jgi:hypothetical protein